MPLVDRVKAILTAPKSEWQVIANEGGAVADVYKGYLVYLAAIPAVASFIGLSLIGVGGFGVTFRVPIIAGLVQAIVGFVLTLVMFYVLALVADALAPTFKGQKNIVNAFKLVAYGATAALVASVLQVFPLLGVLALLGALYSIYLIYTGLPVMMKCPPDKALGYTIVLILCGIVLGFILTIITAFFMPNPLSMGMGGAGTGVAVNTPAGEVRIDTKKLEAAAARMAEAGRSMEAAGKTGDPAQIGQAAQAAIAAMTGQAAREPVKPDVLKALFPEAIGELKRESFESSSGGAMGVAGSTAKARYGSRERSIELEITDAGGFAAIAGMLGALNVTGESERDGRTERMYKDGSRHVTETERRRDGHVEVRTVLGNGVIVELEGRGVALAELKRARDGLDLARLEAIGRR